MLSQNDHKNEGEKRSSFLNVVFSEFSVRLYINSFM